MPRSSNPWAYKMYCLVCSSKISTIFMVKKIIKTGMFVKHEYPRRQQSTKMTIFSINVTVKIIDIGVIWKSFISLVCMPNIRSLSLTVQKLLPMLKRFFLPQSKSLSLSFLVFYVTCKDISVIYVTAHMCRRIEEEVVPTVGLPTT